MKRLVILCLCAALALTAAVSLAACSQKDETPDASASQQEDQSQSQQEDQEEPTPETPTGTIALAMESFQEMDLESFGQYVEGISTGTGSVNLDAIPAEYSSLLSSATDRVSYKVKSETIDGDTATVELDVTSADLAGAIDTMVVEATKYMAKQALTGNSVDIESFVTSYVQDELDVEGLPDKTTPVTVQLTKQSDGTWVVANTEENMALVDAMTGGAVSKAESYADLISQFVN